MTRITTRLFLIALAAAGIVLPASAQTPPAQISVFLDRSTSSPLTTDQAYASSAGVKAANIIAPMMIGDSVQLVNIGTRAASSVLPRKVTITRQRRAPDVGRGIGQIIADTPKHPEAFAKETSITYALENVAITCTPRSVVMIFSDGIETGPESDIEAVIKGKAQFAPPARPFLEGCAVQMHGLGITADGEGQLTLPQQAALEAAWRAYFEAAGASSITISRF